MPLDTPPLLDYSCSMIDSIKKTINERLTTPLGTTFLISWTIFNWPIILTFLSEYSSEHKIYIISEQYYDAITFFWKPLGCTFLVLLIYPLLSIVAYGLWEWAVPKKKIIKSNFGSTSLLTDDEKKQHDADMAQKEKNMEERLERMEKEMKATENNYQKQIIKNKKIIETLEIEITDYKKSIKKLETNIVLLKTKTILPEKTDTKNSPFAVIPLAILHFLAHTPNSKAPIIAIESIIETYKPNMKDYEKKNEWIDINETRLFSHIGNELTLNDNGMKYLKNNPPEEIEKQIDIKKT